MKAIQYSKHLSSLSVRTLSNLQRKNINFFFFFGVERAKSKLKCHCFEDNFSHYLTQKDVKCIKVNYGCERNNECVCGNNNNTTNVFP